MKKIAIVTAFQNTVYQHEMLSEPLGGFFPWALANLTWIFEPSLDWAHFSSWSPGLNSSLPQTLFSQIESFDHVLFLASPVVWPWSAIWFELLKNPPSRLLAQGSKCYGFGSGFGSQDLPIRIYTKKPRAQSNSYVFTWMGPVYAVERANARPGSFSVHDELKLLLDCLQEPEDQRTARRLAELSARHNEWLRVSRPRGLRPGLFLDRDGVVIEFEDYLADPEKVTLRSDVLRLILEANRRDWPVVIVTNQSGVGRNLFAMEQVAAVHARIDLLLKSFSAKIAGYYSATFISQSSDLRSLSEPELRKPLAGMFLKSAMDLDIELELSVMLGDRLTDLQAAQAAGLSRLVRVLDERQPARENWTGFPCIEFSEDFHL